MCVPMYTDDVLVADFGVGLQVMFDMVQAKQAEIHGDTSMMLNYRVKQY